MESECNSWNFFPLKKRKEELVVKKKKKKTEKNSSALRNEKWNVDEKHVLNVPSHGNSSNSIGMMVLKHLIYWEFIYFFILAFHHDKLKHS